MMETVLQLALSFSVMLNSLGIIWLLKRLRRHAVYLEAMSKIMMFLAHEYNRLNDSNINQI